MEKRNRCRGATYVNVNGAAGCCFFLACRACTDAARKRRLAEIPWSQAAAHTSRAYAEVRGSPPSLGAGPPAEARLGFKPPQSWNARPFSSGCFRALVRGGFLSVLLRYHFAISLVRARAHLPHDVTLADFEAFFAERRRGLAHSRSASVPAWPQTPRMTHPSSAIAISPKKNEERP